MLNCLLDLPWQIRTGTVQKISEPSRLLKAKENSYYSCAWHGASKAHVFGELGLGTEPEATEAALRRSALRSLWVKAICHFPIGRTAIRPPLPTSSPQYLLSQTVLWRSWLGRRTHWMEQKASNCESISSARSGPLTKGL